MIRSLLALAVALSPVALAAQPALPAPPRLIVVIAVDQFSADLFAEYRARFTGGMKRMADGVVFPSGYQSHAATETCPGHSTILTGDRPSRTGIVANGWVDQRVTRPDKTVYCAEDERVSVSSKPGEYVPSVTHLLVPTLGDRMKAADARARVVAVAGKDRAAIMMGGARTDEMWFLRPTDYAAFETLAGRTTIPGAVTKANAAIERALARPVVPYRLSPLCASRARPVAIGATKTVGDGRFARAAGDKRAFRASPESDAATLTLAGDLIADMKLGRGPAADLIAIGVSATDVVGHTYGTEGSEMCLQLTELDAQLGRFFKRLDDARLDYAVVLTADHGGHDIAERNDQDALPDAQRVAAALLPKAVGATIARELGLSVPALLGAEPSGDVWVNAALPVAVRNQVLARAKTLYLASPQVAAAFTAAEIEATPIATTPPELWTPIERARASYARGRSGDLVVLLRPRVTPIPIGVAASGSYVATHGSAWDYDRRVPILFWRRGLAPFEQPNSVETVDIAPTIASLVGLPVKPGDMDGRCLDIVAGTADNCPLVVVFR